MSGDVFSDPVEISSPMKQWAMEKRDAHIKGPRYDSAIGSPGNLYVGYLGEAAFWKYAKGLMQPIARVDKSSHDFIYRDIIQVDVKTWASKYDPKEEYITYISELDSSRGQGTYLFGCLNTLKEHVIFVGWKGCHEFSEYAELREKGSTEEGGFVYKVNTMTMKISDLNPMKDL